MTNVNLKEPKEHLKISSKIKTIEQLTTISEQLRSENKRIVYCHGVFDLLHIGHVRHFGQAKKMGDILIVTITPDQFVNKGPHRPAFTDRYRAEVIAALECVDYVAINQWTTAAPTIKLLRPHFYVKGEDYKNAAKDYTGGIILEEEAVKSIQGKIVFTKDITFSSSSLINKHLPSFPDEVTAYLADFSTRFNSSEVIGHLENAGNSNVLVVGEAIIDEYQFCEAIGKSSKEPMLAVKNASMEKYVGGILAVANHIASFVREVRLITFLGEQKSEEHFIREHLNPKVKPVFLYRKNSPTIVKRRLIESYFFTKMMELYELNDGLLEPDDNASLCAMLKQYLPQYDLTIAVDFGHSLFTKEAIKTICEESKFLSVNVQTNAGNIGYQSIVKYPRADYVCLTENEIRMEARDRRGNLKEIIEQMARTFDYKRVTITRGKHGCICYSKQDGFVEVPAFAGRVLDRMGAGDAFLAITALCAVQETPPEVTGFIGNCAGALSVGTIGHSSFIDKVPLYKHIESLLK